MDRAGLRLERRQGLRRGDAGGRGGGEALGEPDAGYVASGLQISALRLSRWTACGPHFCAVPWSCATKRRNGCTKRRMWYEL